MGICDLSTTSSIYLLLLVLYVILHLKYRLVSSPSFAAVSSKPHSFLNLIADEHVLFGTFGSQLEKGGIPSLGREQSTASSGGILGF